MRAIAEAHPNIALIKYWGKQDRAANVPAVGSLSVTLSSLRSRTEVRFDEQWPEDRVSVAGGEDETTKRRVSACLSRFRRLAGLSAGARVVSEGNFPLAAGLASSASGFAALVTAANAAAGSALSQVELARLAGRASGSAARSMFGGFVRLDLPAPGTNEIVLTQLAQPTDWPLEVVIAVTERTRKAIGSTEAMLASEKTSPFYRRWVRDQVQDLDEAEAAVRTRDFPRLAEVAEFNCLKMHSLTFTSRPAVMYWKPATLACLHAVREARGRGYGTFFTIDAGPQVKAICLPEAAEEVARILRQVPGVADVLRCGLGSAPRVLEGR